MTRILSIVPRDSRSNNWLFSEESEGGSTAVRPQYRKFRCAGCGKLDELAAIESGLPSLVVKSDWDVVGLTDGFICVKGRVRQVLDQKGVTGLSFQALPADPRYELMMPTSFVDFDPALSGFEYREPRCALCGRFREVLVGPLARSLAVPQDPLVIFACKCWSEDSRGKVVWLFCLPPVERILQQARLTGVDIEEAL